MFFQDRGWVNREISIFAKIDIAPSAKLRIHAKQPVYTICMISRLASVILLLLSLWLPGAHSAQAAAQPLRIYFIDVGQGDAALLRDPDGFDVLIDGGPPEAGAALVDFLQAQGVNEIDVMVATHSDNDHTGGLATVLQATDISVKALVYNGLAASGGAWQDVLTAAAARGLTPIASGYPDIFTWGTLVVQVLNPAPALDGSFINEQSLVLRVQYGKVRFLFTGDIDGLTEADLLARGVPLEAEVLKVAHHGSADGSTSAFLEAVAAGTAVISVGADNSYGHPTQETLNRLASAGYSVHRTDLEGTLTIESDGDSFTVSSGQGTRVYLPLVYGQQVDAPALPEIRIDTVFADGSGANEPDEYVTLRSAANTSVALGGWTLRDNAGHIFTFPSFSLQPAQICRVYTNEDHPEWCGFNYASSSAI